ncbi:septum site-determining protein MinC [Nitratiruptor sp. SB155-2]|uniref:septum site-determining protein MinC n=1 Tax=Nitratiruptor sp. (strain SB155-2) TaxID=387092 RepID=UPI0001586FBC|nr:septum site-determining protein MinC [Nitratiruptor sp. SB155-2]BAF69934.1 conserved hypothetical protein [Nitratiruptor sp. SB155-2]
MQINQYNVSVMEIEIKNEEEFLQFIKPKIPLLKDYLLHLKGDVTRKIENFLDMNRVQYVKNLDLHRLKRVKKQELPIGVDVCDRVVRSGEEIVTRNTVLCLKRVNDGALIKTSGNFIALDSMDGTAECSGNFMLFKKGPKSKIIFHNHVLDNFIDGHLYKVSLDEEGIVIEKIKE